MLLKDAIRLTPCHTCHLMYKEHMVQTSFERKMVRSPVNEVQIDCFSQNDGQMIHVQHSFGLAF